MTFADLQAEFQELEPRERLEALLECSESLPELPERFQKQRDAGEHRVRECQSPVYLWVEVEPGRVQIYADVPRSAPTVRGLLGLLVTTLSGATPEEVQSIQPTLLRDLGLADALGISRLRGLQGVILRLKSSVAGFQPSRGIDPECNGTAGHRHQDPLAGDHGNRPFGNS